ncbi:MAG: ABC transporter substrate-binding protein [Candidatus Wallbacteria bacterium]|nr:ABC transporter substrate-binding protein [Candidatus Wallbacteria bacterium]
MSSAAGGACLPRAAALCLLAGCLALFGCGEPKEPELWIYTSIYREVLDKLAPQAQAAMAGVKLRWYKAGSEEVAARITAELASGQTPADILMTADPFWYQALKEEGLLRPYRPPEASRVPPALTDPEGAYLTSRAAVMVIGYNAQVFSADQAPETFAELTQPRWQGKVVIGDPLKSGTALATVAMLSNKLGWDYFKALRASDVVVEGGNSAVLRRIETGDRPVGVLLLENLLKARENRSPVEIVYPRDGAVVIPSPIAIVAGTDQPVAAERFVRFVMSPEGQRAMVEGYMYPADPGIAGPKGSAPFTRLLAMGRCLDTKFVREMTAERETLKETFGQIMFE